MTHRFLKRLRRQDGFTLIELIVVVAILGILAAVLTPRVLDAIDNAKKSGAEATGKQLQLAMERVYLKEGGFPSTAEMTDWDKVTPSSLAVTDLVALLNTYTAIEAKQYKDDTATDFDYVSTDKKSYTLTVTLADSGKKLTITPNGVTINP